MFRRHSRKALDSQSTTAMKTWCSGSTIVGARQKCHAEVRAPVCGGPKQSQTIRLSGHRTYRGSIEFLSRNSRSAGWTFIVADRLRLRLPRYDENCSFWFRLPVLYDLKTCPSDHREQFISGKNGKGWKNAQSRGGTHKQSNTRQPIVSKCGCG